MFNIIAFSLYFLIISICLVVSLLRRKDNKFPVFIYFLIVGIIEIIAFFMKGTSMIYQVGSLIYIVFFTLYYANFTYRLKNEIYIAGGVSFIGVLFYILKFEQNFPTEIGIIISVLYIVLAFAWFYTQIKLPGKDFIVSNQVFWISAANFLWGIIFLFRVSLMYWLAENDPEFLMILDKIFKIFVLLTYFFLLIAVTRKQYSVNE